MNKNLPVALAGHLFFIGMFFLALLHYQERMLNFDSAWYSFQLINFGEMNLGRPAAFFSQFLPWLLVKFGLPLKLIMQTFSISFVLIYYLLYLLISVKLKSSEGGILLCLVLILCVRDSFFNPVSEIFIGCAFAALYHAYATSKRESKLFIPFSLAIVVLCFLSHPATLFLVLFSSLYLIVETRSIRCSLWIPSGAISILYLVKMLFTPTTAPEGAEFQSALSVFGHLPDFFSAPPTQQLINHLFLFSSKYLIWLIALGLALGIMAFKKRWIQAGLTLLFTFGYLAVTNAVYAIGESAIVLEKSLVPLAFFPSVAIAAMVRESKSIQRLWLMAGVLLLVFFLKFRDLGKQSKYYAQGFQYYREIAIQGEAEAQCKFMMTQSEVEKSPLLIPWAIPVESLLASSLAGFAITVAVDRTGAADDEIYLPEFVGTINISELNSHYFRIKPQGYKPLPVP